jgi:hypothetical protein
MRERRGRGADRSPLPPSTGPAGPFFAMPSSRAGAGAASVGAAVAAVVVAAAAGAAAAGAAFPFSIQVGAPAYVLYPNATGQRGIPDQSTLVLNFTAEGVLRGYTAWLDTVLFIDGPSLSAVTLPAANVTCDWDIEAAVVDPADGTTVHGFEHREHGWMIDGGYFYQSPGPFFFFSRLIVCVCLQRPLYLRRLAASALAWVGRGRTRNLFPGDASLRRCVYTVAAADAAAAANAADASAAATAAPLRAGPLWRTAPPRPPLPSLPPALPASFPTPRRAPRPPAAPRRRGCAAGWRGRMTGARTRGRPCPHRGGFRVGMDEIM